MSLNIPRVSHPSKVAVPPFLIRLAAIVGALGGLVTVLGILIPGFVTVSPESIVTLAGEDISGSYLSSPLIATKTMGVVLGMGGIISIIAAILTSSWWEDRKKLAAAMTLLLASGSYDIVFTLVYFNDPHIQDAYALGAQFGLGQGMVVLGATFLTMSGLMVFIHGMRMNVTTIDRMSQPVMREDSE
ncbi:hypothetical protein [Arcanobacterium buesumense]|uniref:Uncharacterized protein n=1 Tax=Arcanobacterium buesumense TaxID=2722751 RepID=A0A6H2EKN0_9ACTO|nr:hypothetical protein [Arcanobacterium buesumense]QJC21820.1 hypothetical protein HC352_04420 [Arcanobacterium buesumense]